MENNADVLQKWIVVQNVVHLYYELRLSSAKEWTVDTWNSWDVNPKGIMLSEKPIQKITRYKILLL